MGIACNFSPREIDRELGKYVKHYEKLRTLFGKNFCGIDEVRQAFTLQSERAPLRVPNFVYKPIFKALWDKCHEPDVAIFLSRIEEGTVNVKDWLLMLRTPSFRHQKKDISVTMRALQDYIAPDMLTRNQGKLFYNPNGYYTRDVIDTSDIQVLHWQFVTKKCLKGTLKKAHAKQTTALNAYAKKVGFDPTLTRRRKPLEVVWDFMILLRSHGIRILLGKSDQTDARAWDNSLFHVGIGDEEGLDIDAGLDDEFVADHIGAVLSR